MKSGTTYQVGYGRPPQGKRWQKGQCGNPRRRKLKSLNLGKLIEEFFAKTIIIKENGIARRTTNFEAILLQLWTKAAAGDRRAAKVLLKYTKFSTRQGGVGRVEIEFENEPTKP